MGGTSSKTVGEVCVNVLAKNITNTASTCKSSTANIINITSDGCATYVKNTNISQSVTVDFECVIGILKKTAVTDKLANDLRAAIAKAGGTLLPSITGTDSQVTQIIREKISTIIETNTTTQAVTAAKNEAIITCTHDGKTVVSGSNLTQSIDNAISAVIKSSDFSTIVRDVNAKVKSDIKNLSTMGLLAIGRSVFGCDFVHRSAHRPSQVSPRRLDNTIRE